jgi:hypothetical protein
MNNSLLGHNAGLGGVISKKNKLYKKLKFKWGFCDYKYWATEWKLSEKKKQYFIEYVNGNENYKPQSIIFNEVLA